LLERAVLVIAAQWSIAVRPGRDAALGLYSQRGTAEYDAEAVPAAVGRREELLLALCVRD
jgi:hypothetical protein